MKPKKYHGFIRFDYFLNQLEELLIKAAKQKNPALWLYRNNARIPLFMLEALARVYAAIYREWKFLKLDAQFKLLEDLLGAIDYYDSFSKEFAANKKMPESITTYLQAMTREKIQSLNEVLREKKWINTDKGKVETIRVKLASTKWKKESKEIKGIRDYYIRSIEEITKFTLVSDFHFENVESDVHALRRKLRWLSIYPQALRGSIQVSKVVKVPAHLKKYLTKEIIESTFNKMPDVGNNKHFLLLEQNYFYALSWMIAELGRLKDSGLRVIVIKEALQQGASLNDATAFKKVYQLLDNKQPTIPAILKKADAVCKKYFDEKNLDHLLIGTRYINIK
jgi:hypothetical protein